MEKFEAVTARATNSRTVSSHRKRVRRPREDGKALVEKLSGAKSLDKA